MRLRLKPATTWGIYRALFLLFFALVLSRYANSLGNDFVFDDIELIVENESLRSLSRLADFWPFSGRSSGYRPVRFLSYLLDYQLYGLNPTGFRLSNLVYHTVNTFLVFLLSRFLGLSFFASLCSSLVFLSHPLQTESVAYISGRRDLLFTLFYLSGLLVFGRHYHDLKSGRTLLITMLMLLGFFSKEMAASFPFMLVWLAFWLELRSLKRNGAKLSGWGLVLHLVREVWNKTWPLVVLISCLTLAFVGYKLFYWRPTSQVTYWGGNMVNNFLTVSSIWVYYIGLILVPIPLKGDYSIAAFPIVNNAGDIIGWTSFGLIVLFVAIALTLTRSKPVIAFSCVWFAISLLPVSHIFPHHELMAEHYLYLPLVGFALIAGWLLSALMGKGYHRVTVGVLMVLISCYGTRTIVRNLDWQTSFHFWKSAVRFEPVAARACLNLGVLYERQGNEAEFLHYLHRSISIKPSARAIYNLGVHAQDKGEREKAIVLYKQAMDLDLNFHSPYFNLGFIYKQMGESELALQTFAKFHSFSTTPDLLFASGVTSFDAGDYDTARAYFERVRQRRVSYEGVHYYLGRCHEQQGNCSAARASYLIEIKSGLRFSSISQRHYQACLNQR